MALLFEEYPVTVTAEELANERAIDIVGEYGTAQMVGYMAEVHASVYEGAIYATGRRDIKNRIIKAQIDKEKSDLTDETALTETEKAIKRALILQAAYLHDEGNVGTSSGITISADGQKAVIGRAELRSKNVCIAALDALKGCPCPILYAGEDI